jgi:hypothetical protein
LHFISCSLRTRQAPSQEARNSARWQEEGKEKEEEEKSKLTYNLETLPWQGGNTCLFLFFQCTILCHGQAILAILSPRLSGKMKKMIKMNNMMKKMIKMNNMMNMKKVKVKMNINKKNMMMKMNNNKKNNMMVMMMMTMTNMNHKHE